MTTLDYLFRNQRKTALPSHTNRCLCLHCRLLALTVNASFYSLEGERSRSSAKPLKNNGILAVNRAGKPRFLENVFRFLGFKGFLKVC